MDCSVTGLEVLLRALARRSRDVLGVTRPLRGAEVWCPGARETGCRSGVLFEFPCYRPVYRPEESCQRHPLSAEQVFRLGQDAYRKYQRSTPYLWVDSWEGDPR